MNLDQWWPRVEDLARRLVAAARGDRARAWQPGPHWQRRKLNFAIRKSRSSRPSTCRYFLLREGDPFFWRAPDLGAAPKPGVEQPPRSDHWSRRMGMLLV